MVRSLLLNLSVLIALVPGSNAHSNSQLPQLVNADGSLTSRSTGDDRPALDFSQFGSSNVQQSYQQGKGLLAQTGSDLKQTAQGMADHLQNAGETLGNAPRHFVDNINNMGQQISNSLDNLVQSGLNKLNELKDQLSEKFRPLLDGAIQIFQTSKPEKEKWNELVQRVESTDLNEQEKQILYQRVADATAPQQQQTHHKK